MTDNRSLLASLSRDDLQGLYDHLGTIPFAPGSWSHNWRAALSEVLATKTRCGVSRLYAGAEQVCTKPKGHDGMHEKGPMAWNDDPRSPVQRWGRL